MGFGRLGFAMGQEGVVRRSEVARYVNGMYSKRLSMYIQTDQDCHELYMLRKLSKQMPGRKGRRWYVGRLKEKVRENEALSDANSSGELV